MTRSKHTDCSLYFFCSSRRTSTNASKRCFLFSSNSSACSFSLACCFFSMSTRRFCAVDDELCDNVPSRAPNSLCPRLRSSICPLLRRSDDRSGVGNDGFPAAPSSSPDVCFSRGRLLLCSDTDDCLRFVAPSIDGSFSTVSGSGRLTAEAITLYT